MDAHVDVGAGHRDRPRPGRLSDAQIEVAPSTIELGRRRSEPLVDQHQPVLTARRSEASHGVEREDAVETTHPPPGQGRQRRLLDVLGDLPDQGACISGVMTGMGSTGLCTSTEPTSNTRGGAGTSGADVVTLAPGSAGGSPGPPTEVAVGDDVGDAASSAPSSSPLPPLLQAVIPSAITIATAARRTLRGRIARPTTPVTEAHRRSRSADRSAKHPQPLPLVHDDACEAREPPG